MAGVAGVAAVPAVGSAGVAGVAGVAPVAGVAGLAEGVSDDGAARTAPEAKASAAAVAINIGVLIQNPFFGVAETDERSG